MSKLEQLIAEFCPNGVEYKSLEEVCLNIYSGRNKIRDDSGTYSVYGSTGIIGYTDKFVYSNESILVARVGANCGYVHIASGCYDVSDNTLIISPNEDMYILKFAYYQLVNMNLNKYAKGGGQPLITAGQLKTLKIPLPPLPVQYEIVRIIDNFTELTTEFTAELTAELTARKKQYEYYCNELLTVDDMPTVSLGEVCVKTSNIRWKDTGEEYYYIDLTSVDRETNTIHPEKTINADNAPSRAQQIIQTNDVLFATTRPTLKRYCFIPEQYDGQICSTGYCVLRANPEVIIPKYLYYIITTENFNLYVESNQKGASYPAISDSEVKRYSFSLPSFEEQSRIVAILDKFNLLTIDISNALPAEIEARRKQYEFYRDKLLTFKELEV